MFVEIGTEAVAGRTADGERLVVGIAVPTRAYASVLAAVGAVTRAGDVASGITAYAPERREEHLLELQRLPPGAVVTVTSGKVLNVGVFEGLETHLGEPYLVVQQGGARRQTGFRQLIAERSCHQIDVNGLPLQCLLIGQVSLLEQEITGYDVVTENGDPIQTILKVGRFCMRRDRDVRSDIASPGAELPQRLVGARPSVVVFDGTAALRRWRERWRSAPWIVILDRSSPQFDEGVLLLEEEYVQRGTSKDFDLEQLPVPGGSEIMAFWSRR